MTIEALGWGGGREGCKGLGRYRGLGRDRGGEGEHSRSFARLMGNRWKDFVSVFTVASGEIINAACHPSLSAASVKFHHALDNSNNPKKKTDRQNGVFILT